MTYSYTITADTSREFNQIAYNNCSLFAVVSNLQCCLQLLHLKLEEGLIKVNKSFIMHSLTVE